jgi:coenzyme F420-reducing hydrogenase delta subunit
VVISGCRESDCEFRLGDKWVQNRMSGNREPRLRAAAPRERIAIVWAGNQREQVMQAIASLRFKVQALSTTSSSPTIAVFDEHSHELHDD